MKRAYCELKDGMVKATIWHEIRDGVKQYNIAFTRLFKDTDRWWDGACFQPQDMPALYRLANDIEVWISLQSQDEDDDEGGTGGAW